MARGIGDGDRANEGTSGGERKATKMETGRITTGGSAGERRGVAFQQPKGRTLWCFHRCEGEMAVEEHNLCRALIELLQSSVCFGLVRSVGTRGPSGDFRLW